MRLLDIFNRHPRGDISAHADGELAPDRLDALETHLAGCQRCRTELDGLLTVRSALRDLPQVAAPRSFTLTPAMAEREPPPVTSRTTPSFVAMRIAGAGFAAVLAVVVMLDAGGIVDDNGGRGGDDSSTALFESAATGTPGVQEDAFAPTSDVTDGDGDALNLEGIEVPPTSDDGSDPASGGTTGGLEPPDAPEDARNGSGGDDFEPAAAPQAGDGAPESGEGTATAITSEDDGLSSLLVIEIGLAAIAALAIGGSFVMRRRTEQE
jgi:hypothetical protein